jgi:hypothetical protein
MHRVFVKSGWVCVHRPVRYIYDARNQKSPQNLLSIRYVSDTVTGNDPARMFLDVVLCLVLCSSL